eukprot:354471-Chlamydomonas_euryale.AAC.7
MRHQRSSSATPTQHQRSAKRQRASHLGFPLSMLVPGSPQLLRLLPAISASMPLPGLAGPPASRLATGLPKPTTQQWVSLSLLPSGGPRQEGKEGNNSKLPTSQSPNPVGPTLPTTPTARVRLLRTVRDRAGPAPKRSPRPSPAVPPSNI